MPGLLATTIQKDLNISNQEYASIINYFLIACTMAILLSGRVVDNLGVRWSLALFVAWWTPSVSGSAVRRTSVIYHAVESETRADTSVILCGGKLTWEEGSGVIPYVGGAGASERQEAEGVGGFIFSVAIQKIAERGGR